MPPPKTATTAHNKKTSKPKTEDDEAQQNSKEVRHQKSSGASTTGSVSGAGFFSFLVLPSRWLSLPSNGSEAEGDSEIDELAPESLFAVVSHRSIIVCFWFTLSWLLLSSNGSPLSVWWPKRATLTTTTTSMPLRRRRILVERNWLDAEWTAKGRRSDLGRRRRTGSGGEEETSSSQRLSHPPTTATARRRAIVLLHMAAAGRDKMLLRDIVEQLNAGFLPSNHRENVNNDSSSAASSSSASFYPVVVNAYLNFMTPLYVAAENNRTEAVEVLLHEFGADPNLRELVNGTSPLHVAAKLGNVDVIRALLTHGTSTMVNLKVKKPPSSPARPPPPNLAKLSAADHSATDGNRVRAESDEAENVNEKIRRHNTEAEDDDSFEVTPLELALAFHQHEAARLLRAAGGIHGDKETADQRDE